MFVNGYSQKDMHTKNVKFTAAIQSIISSDTIKPFWSRVNKYGTVPLKGNMLAIDLRVVKEFDSLFTDKKILKKLGFGYGVRALGSVNNKKSILFLPEAYVKVRHKHFELYVGKRQEVFGLVDTVASSGSYIWSGNAMPLPKLQVHTPGYLPITKKGFLSIKAGLSHGWFSDNGIVKNHWLHQKWLYGKIGRKDSKVQFSAGINHQVMWGGYSEVLKNVGGEIPPTIDGYLAPFPLYSYQFVLIPFLQKIILPDGNKVPGYDGGLAIGNQLGSVDLAFDIKIGGSSLLVYTQQPYDFARSLYNLNNIEDGLYGISLRIKNKIINKVCFEYFDTRSQGRYLFGKLQPSNYGEIDNYFSHGQYQSWSNHGNIIGSPFIIDEIYSKSNDILSNRVFYYYGSVFGKVFDLDYAFKFASSSNLGTYFREINKKQNSMNLSFSKSVKRHFLIGLDFSMDRGYLYPNTIAFGIKANYQY
ncbi:Capsule assembly protein Wzi [Spirosomataceae bacterium TFI 002]|nr:Capsule assembly protein Wzi [Spirosomataceae bacterium TFI 002]